MNLPNLPALAADNWPVLIATALAVRLVWSYFQDARRRKRKRRN